MIAKLLSFTGLPQWAMEVLIIALVAFGVWYWQHRVYEFGIHEQVLADASADAKLQKKVDADTAVLQAQADSAERAYDHEHQINLGNQLKPAVDSVSLCIPASADNAVPKARAPNPGNAHPRTGPGNVPAVPAGDRGSGAQIAGPDISPMLRLFAAKADETAATLREYQSRNPPTSTR